MAACLPHRPAIFILVPARGTHSALIQKHISLSLLLNSCWFPFFSLQYPLRCALVFYFILFFLDTISLFVVFLWSFSWIEVRQYPVRKWNTYQITHGYMRNEIHIAGFSSHCSEHRPVMIACIIFWLASAPGCRSCCRLDLNAQD